jgi:transcriptional regulator with XRE-family HTH domain
MEVPSIYRIFGPRLARVRKAAELTQAELGRRVGLSRASIANIEAGNQRVFLDQVFQLVQALGPGSLQELLTELPIGEMADRNGIILTGAKRLSRQQEQLLARILADVGENP